jgi:hypothetical protein
VDGDLQLKACCDRLPQPSGETSLEILQRAFIDFAEAFS